MRSDKEEAAYFAKRAREETRRVKEGINRGDPPEATAAHGELATRYHAKAFVKSNMD
jgi:hypothetical protein